MRGYSYVQGGIGLWAEAPETGGTGVSGSGKAYGVRGSSATGIAGDFASTGGTALKATGKVRFNRSGRASIRAGASTVSVTVPGGLSGTPLAFATLMTSRSGVYVRAVTSSSTTGKITIRLNKVASTTSSTSVAWVVLG